MAFVLYDLETSGLNRHFDQIVQFGGVQLNDDLEIVDTFEVQCRLQPHIVPAPSALQVMGRAYEELTSASLPSHFSTMVAVHQKLTSWCPAAFLGYNSISFDEEFLRHGFYQCLLDPYLTSTGNARADVLRLARATAVLRPDVLPPVYGDGGQPSMRLRDVALACGFVSRRAHEAMADVEALLAVCRRIAEGAPELWSRLLQFSTKAAAIDFMREEDAFIAFEPYGAGRGFYVLTAFGVHPTQDARRYCLDLTTDVDGLRNLTVEELVVLFASRGSPLRRVKANTSPVMFPLYECLDRIFPDLMEQELLRTAARLRSDADFVQKLCTAAYASERQWDKSLHVEQQLYDGFFSADDKARAKAFHGADWPERLRIVPSFADERLRRLGQRAVYLERRDLLPPATADQLDVAVHGRWMGDEASPWMTARRALRELDDLGVATPFRQKLEQMLLA